MIAATRRLARRLRSVGWGLALGIAAPLGMLAVSAVMLVELRRDAWDQAAQTSQNLLQVIARDIDRNVEIIDLSLQAVIDNLKTPGLSQLTPEMRRLVLFDRAATARDLGGLLVLDENGDAAAASFALSHPINLADRSYFRVHRESAGLGLQIGTPLISRRDGERILVLSRRIDRADGSFGGVAIACLKLSYFIRLFDQIGLGRDGAINLFHRDGTRVMRYPYADADIGVNIAGSSNFARYREAEAGRFVAPSIRDGVERSYTFTQVGALPLILNVALSTAEIEAEWRSKACVIGAVLLLLGGLTITLAVLFGRELRRRARAQDELATLSRTDPLTGLANRRRFDEAASSEIEEARRTGRRLTLAIVDVDHFKRINDRYGHAIGDTVLEGLARCLAGSVHRPRDLVCRLGGEEFALLLPDTDTVGGRRVANTVHARVAALTIEAFEPGAAAITVSIGLATTGDGPTIDARSLYRSADAALYEAKAAGRNRTRWAAPHDRLVPTAA